MKVKYFDSGDLIRRFEKRNLDLQVPVIDERLKSLRVVIHVPCPTCRKDTLYLLDTAGVEDISDRHSLVTYHCKECGGNTLRRIK